MPGLIWRMPIRKTMYASLAINIVAIVLLAVIGSMGAISLQSSVEPIGHQREVATTALNLKTDVVQSDVNQQLLTLAYRQVGPAALQSEDMKNFQAMLESIAKSFDKFPVDYLDKEEKANFDAAKSANEELNGIITKLVGQLQSGDPAQVAAAVNDAHGIVPETRAIVTDNLTKLAEDADKEASRLDSEARNSASSLMVWIWVMAVIGILVMFLGLLTLAMSLTGGLKAIRLNLAKVAAGDLTETIPSETLSYELKATADSANKAVDFMRQTLGASGTAAGFVAASSNELSATLDMVLQAARDNKTQGDQIAASAGEVSRNIATVAAGAEQMGASIREISSNANEAARVAADATAMAAQTNQIVSQLGESSKEIGEVIKSITAIAEQTNLLALNATIEAARAGEAGKGFAVVAGEVKDLAAETGRATEEISRRIEQIQADTNNSVDAIERISGIIASINDYQTTIAAAVEEQTATTNEMSRSVAEAAQGASTIADEITDMANDAGQSAIALVEINKTVGKISDAANTVNDSVRDVVL